MWKNTVKPENPQKENGACTLHAPRILKATYTLRICNIYCLSTATMLTAKQLNFKLYEQYIACLFPFLFVSYHLLRMAFMKHLLSFSGIRRHVNFLNTCILLDTNVRDFWRYVICRLDYISVTVSQVSESDGWVLVNYMHKFKRPICVWTEEYRLRKLLLLKNTYLQEHKGNSDIARNVDLTDSYLMLILTSLEVC